MGEAGTNNHHQWYIHAEGSYSQFPSHNNRHLFVWVLLWFLNKQWRHALCLILVFSFERSVMHLNHKVSHFPKNITSCKQKAWYVRHVPPGGGKGSIFVNTVTVLNTFTSSLDQWPPLHHLLIIMNFSWDKQLINGIHLRKPQDYYDHYTPLLEQVANFKS